MDPVETRRKLMEQFAEFGAASGVDAEEETPDNFVTSRGKVKRKRKAKRKTEDSQVKEVPDASTDNNNKAVPKRKIRPPPEVIVFEEPGKTKRKDNDDYAESKAKKAKSIKDEEEEEFREIADEVKEFGMTGFSRKEQRKYEQRKAQMLGAKAPKGKKMPYKIVMYAAKVRKQREVEEMNQKREMGMMTKKKRIDNKASKPTGSLGWWSDKSKGVNPSVGRFKGGTYHIEKPVKLKKRKTT